MTNLAPIQNSDIPKITNYLSNLTKSNSSFNKFYKAVIELGVLYMVGGALRDIKNDIEPRDLDFIYKGDINSFERVLEDFNLAKNRFGGYKLSFDNIIVDIWSFNDNWAFKHRLFTHSENNIQKGAFYNFDSIVLNINSKKLYSENFNKCLKKRQLDFVSSKKGYIDSNPNIELNIVKAFYVKEKYGLQLSKKIERYILNWKKSEINPPKKLKFIEHSHFNINVFSEEKYSDLLSNLSVH
jgi:hypothetical protein